MNKKEILSAVAAATGTPIPAPAPRQPKAKRDKRDALTKAKQAQKARDEERMMKALRKLNGAADKKAKAKNRNFKPQHVQHPKQRRALQERSPELWALELRRTK